MAKAVAGILSRNQGLRTREGRSRYNKVFEFDYIVRGQPCHMAVTSVTGHLMELDFDDRYRKWYSCDPADLYEAPVRKFVPEDKLDIKRTLEEEARKCQWLVLWLDCDREGENIAYEVIEVCAEVNRNLVIWRARFSALIDREIHQSVQNLVQPNQLFADAVDVRQEIDLRIGASFTRFQTMLLRDAFVLDFIREDRNLVLSYGPCQFPTLGFIVERYWEVQSHEPEDFWMINCSHNSVEGTATFNWMRGHIFDYICAVTIYEMCVLEPTATVTKVRHQEKLKYPPYPLSTIELEKRASRYFRMSSEQTMKVAEDLYQSGFISYPRTETDSFSPRTDLLTIVQDQQGHPLWGSYAQKLLDPEAGLWRNPSSGGHDDNAHPPIHPTKFSAGESGWSQDHHRLYELVVRHFLACVSQPAVGAETHVEIDIAGELFSACGRVVKAVIY